MKKTVFCALCVFCLTPNIYAGQYEGLTPGVSQKSDAEEAWGTPIKNNPQKNLYHYSPEGHDLAALAIGVTDQNIIDRIHLVFQEPYSLGQVKEWFDLPANPTRIEQKNGHRVEFYKQQGIKIIFEGRDAKGAIVQLSHVASFASGNASRKEEDSHQAIPDPENTSERKKKRKSNLSQKFNKAFKKVMDDLKSFHAE
jgi:hypothetical protein